MSASKKCFVVTVIFTHYLKANYPNCFHLLLKVLLHSTFIEWCFLCSTVCYCCFLLRCNALNFNVVHFGHWWEIAFSQMLPRIKKCTVHVTSNYCMTSWRTPSDIYKYRRCEFAAHYDACTFHTLCACFTRNKIINSLCSELSESQQCNYT